MQGLRIYLDPRLCVSDERSDMTSFVGPTSGQRGQLVGESLQTRCNLKAPSVGLRFEFTLRLLDYGVELILCLTGHRRDLFARRADYLLTTFGHRLGNSGGVLFRSRRNVLGRGCV